MWRLRFAIAYLLWAMAWPGGALWVIGGECTAGGGSHASALFRARLLAETGEHRRAAGEFYRCLRANPRQARALVGLFGSLYSLGMTEVADRMASLAIEADPRPRVRRKIAVIRARAQARATGHDPADIGAFAGVKRSGLVGAALPAMLLKISRRQRSGLANRIRVIATREKTRRTIIGVRDSSIPERSPRLNYLDLFYSGLVLIQSLIANKLIRSSVGNPSASYILVLKTFGMIVGHLYLWWVASRPMPSGLSSLTFTLPAFAVYVAFMGGFNKARPREILYPTFAGRRIGFAAFIISEMTWEVLCVIFGTFLALVYCNIVVPGTFNFEPIQYDIPAQFGLIVLAYLIGMSIQSVIQQIVHFVPSLHSISHLLGPAIFITSGVYQTYTSEPVQMQPALWYNPVASVVEFSRQTFAPGYSTGDLSIKYSIIFAFCGILFLVLQGNEMQRQGR